VRSGSEEIRQSNCNAYINCYADLYVSSLLALLTNTYTSVYSCVLFILASVLIFYQALTITEIRVGEKNLLKKIPFYFLFTEETWIRIRNQREKMLDLDPH